MTSAAPPWIRFSSTMDGAAALRCGALTKVFGHSRSIRKYGQPWGLDVALAGYRKPKEERITYGEKEGFEIVDGGYALCGPKYHEHFRDVCST
jgi:hypothetical protein